MLQQLDSLERDIRQLRKECNARNPKEKDLALRHKLKATGYLHNTPKHLLPVIATKILHTLPLEMSLKSIYNLKDNADIFQIQQMNNIISSINAEYKNKQNMEVKAGNVTKAEVSNTSFNIISNQSITNITNYLAKNEVSSFKAASRRMAIICLEQMEKFEIMTMNMNELVDIKYRKHYTNYMNIENELVLNRYNCNRTISFLKEAWSKQYDIKEDDLLLFRAAIDDPSDSGCFQYILQDRHSFSQEHLRISEMEFRPWNMKCFLFDKSNMVKMDANGIVSDVDIANDQMHLDYMIENNVFFLTLLYHDAAFNEIMPIQHMMVTAHSITPEQLGAYIQNGFVAKNEKQRLFQKRFQEQRKTLNANKVFLYKHDEARWKYEVEYDFWWKMRFNDLYDMIGDGMVSRWFAIIFSLAEIEVADYPAPGFLTAYAAGQYFNHGGELYFGE